MSESRLRILIVGGYGTFGGRLAQLLGDEPRLTLMIAGRSLAKAQAFCAGPTRGATLEPVKFDRGGDIDTALAVLKPDILVDASGPFQIMGERPYRVAQACIRHGIDYLDLADSAAFVTGIRALDVEAKAADVAVLSGCSSFPALSFAALDALRPGFAAIASVEAGIAPSPRVRMGLNVIRAVSSYAGKPISVLRGGQPVQGHGLIDGIDMVIAPPGMVPLKRRRFLLADAPDLALLPLALPGLQSVFTGAGTEPQVLQRLLGLLARLVRMNLLPSLLPLSPLFHRASSLLGFGTHRGGMFVRATGKAPDGTDMQRSWHLIAEGEDGPFIPAMASEALIRRRLSGMRLLPGAKSAAGVLTLADFEPLFKRFAIASGIRETRGDGADTPLYRRMLGSAWNDLPKAVADLHDSTLSQLFRGRAKVERGRNWLARMTAAIIGFPAQGDDVPVSVRFDRSRGQELWTRTFAGKSFKSLQSAGIGTDENLLIETFGPFRIRIALVPRQGRLLLVIRGWRFLGMPLPLFLAPGGDTYEEERDGEFRFHVVIASPITGLIVRYTGWLRPAED
jgi:hypothetical protein